MKSFKLFVGACLLGALLLGGARSPAWSASTAITYQGRLKVNNALADGPYDFQFSLYSADTGGTPLGAPLAKEDLMVGDGLMAVELDFGPGAFTGEDRWLEIAVRTGASTGDYTLLTPRQRITATPNALVAGAVPWSGITGLPAGFADGVDNDTVYSAGPGLLLNGTQLSVNFGGTGSSPAVAHGDHTHTTFWNLAGNTGSDPNQAFLGTLDNTKLRIGANHHTALLIEPTTFQGEPAPPNLIGGWEANFADPNVHGGTIAGGGGFALTTFNRVSDNFGFVGGGGSNTAGNADNDTSNAPYATVGGGDGNAANAPYSAITGGQGNQATGSGSAITGGVGNRVTGVYGFIGGGAGGQAEGYAATLAGGDHNAAKGVAATVSGGATNSATGDNAVVSGGKGNAASGNAAMIPGGLNSQATGDYAFAGGYQAHALHRGAFVWADYNAANPAASLDSTAEDQFTARASGGFRLFTDDAATSGVQLAPGAGSWSTLSDRKSKNGFAPVNAVDLLRRLAAIPIQSWSYNAQSSSIRHIGPIAQDFKAAFGVGEDETHISAVDADGVALAGIQGLYALLQRQEVRADELRRLHDADDRRIRGRIRALEEENRALRAAAAQADARLTALERRLDEKP